MNEKSDEIEPVPYRYPRSPHVPTVKKGLCAFESLPDRFQAQTQRPFKPKGLVIWGTPPMATLEIALIGTSSQLLVSFGDFPARWFNQGDKFAQIQEKMDAGKDPAGWGDWKAVEPGVLIRIMVKSREGKPLGRQDGLEVAMWGEYVD